MRGDNGKPTHRVIAKLGALDAVSVENLRTAFKANRDGGTAIVGSRSASSVDGGADAPYVRVRSGTSGLR